MARLIMIVPVSVLLIFVLLFEAFNTVKSAALIFLNVPFALIGGILALYLTGIHLSVSAAIGFIALFGQAVLNGVVMVSHFDQLRHRAWLRTERFMKGRRPVANGADDFVAGDARIASHGSISWHGLGSAAASRCGHHRRPRLSDHSDADCIARTVSDVPCGPGHGNSLTMKRLLLAFTTVCAVLVAQPAPPITIEDAISQAVSNNLDLAAERYNISVAEARQITAKLRPNPVMTVSGDHLDLLGTGYNTINNGGPNEYSLRTDFILERGRKRANRIEYAAAQKRLAELGFQDSLRRLVYDVESAFLDVQVAKENLSLAQDSLRSLNGIVAINTERVRTGDLAGVELERSRIAAMQYETAVRQAELQLLQAKSRLQLLLARPGSTDDLDVTGPMRRDEATRTIDGIRDLAKTRRPDLPRLDRLRSGIRLIFDCRSRKAKSITRPARSIAGSRRRAGWATRWGSSSARRYPSSIGIRERSCAPSVRSTRPPRRSGRWRRKSTMKF